MDGQIHIDGAALVEHHLHHHILFQVAQGFPQLLARKLVLVKGLLVHKIVPGTVGVQVLRLPVVHLGPAEGGVVTLESAFYYRPADQVSHLDAGNGRALLHFVALVIHHLPRLVVQLNDHPLVEVAKVDAHAWYPLVVGASALRC